MAAAFGRRRLDDCEPGRLRPHDRKASRNHDGTKDIPSMKIFQTRKLSISEIAPFGNIDLGVTVNRFCMMGFRPGDAVDVEFSNGFAFRNIPVFSGFYGKGHMPCLYVTSSLYPHVGIGCPVSGNPWAMACVKPGDTARVVLRKRRGFDQLEQRLHLPALLGPAPTRSPQQNANWRSLPAGSIAPNAIYRSCSPIRDDYAAAGVACALMEQAGVRSVLNLSDSPAILQARKAKADAHTAPYLRLYDEGHVLPLHLGVDLSLQGNARTLAHGLLWLSGQPQPALIHCKLGLDRTGAVCALLEMLAGYDYEDIERDYQASYLNLFGPHPTYGQRYPLGDLRLNELLDLLLSFVQKPSHDEGASSATGEKAQNGVPSVAQKRPDSETLRLAARAYLAFGGLDEAQIDRIERMLGADVPPAKEMAR